MSSLHRQFLLDPAVTFLNHGSFGATPRPVFQAYQRWQRELERQPVEFLGRCYQPLMAAAREALGDFLGAKADDLVYTTNVTVSLNIVARSLDLGRGDEVLTSDHEYGALDRTWRFLAKERGFRYINQPISLPQRDSVQPSEMKCSGTDRFLDELWKGVTKRTRVIFLSHITSPTAQLFPVAEVVQRARPQGILTVIDGAHAPGQIPLNLDALGADFYGGNLHKWLCAPKSAGFLHARPEMQSLLKPLVVSWGYEAEMPGPSPLIDHHEYWGTRDIASFLAVPEAIRFQAENDWEQVRASCRLLLAETVQRLQSITGGEALDEVLPGRLQMAVVPLPSSVDLTALKNRLYDEYRIEVPAILWNDRKFLRVSIQGYNTRRDASRLVAALQALLK